MMMSGSEYLDELLQVYDVGGQSFITKPLDPKLLKTQLAHMLQQSADRALMQSQLQFATQTAFTAMSSVGETGALLQALKALNFFCLAERFLLSHAGFFGREDPPDRPKGGQGQSCSVMGPALSLSLSLSLSPAFCTPPRICRWGLGHQDAPLSVLL